VPAKRAGRQRKQTGPLPRDIAVQRPVGVSDADYLKWQTFTRRAIGGVLTVFLLMNLSVLGLVGWVWWSESERGVAGARVVTENPVLTLIKATAAQLGALAVGSGIALLRQGGRK
jgi:hypothetical protein